jgi:hypothetical protein
VNLSWEADAGDRTVKNAIRRARVRLLLEHVGALSDARASVRAVVGQRGLVARLDALAESGASRLRKHDRHHEEPNAITKAVQELACEVLDPADGAEPAPVSRPSAA